MKTEAIIQKWGREHVSPGCPRTKLPVKRKRKQKSIYTVPQGESRTPSKTSLFSGEKNEFRPSRVCGGKKMSSLCLFLYSTSFYKGMLILLLDTRSPGAEGVCVWACALVPHVKGVSWESGLAKRTIKEIASLSRDTSIPVHLIFNCLVTYYTNGRKIDILSPSPMCVWVPVSFSFTLPSK